MPKGKSDHAGANTLHSQYSPQPRGRSPMESPTPLPHSLNPELPHDILSSQQKKTEIHFLVKDQRGERVGRFTSPADFDPMPRQKPVPESQDCPSNATFSKEQKGTRLNVDRASNNDRTLKELATPYVVYQSWCIQYPQLELAQTYELKSGLIHLLPKFHGLVGEDPHKHLKEFHVVCSTMRPYGIPEDYIKMKAFPFSLDRPAFFNTWGDTKHVFLEKFFLASRTASIWKEICGIRQHPGETLYEYWERFNKLYATCPHYKISEQLLIQYFYEGLSMMDRSMIDAASGGELMDKTLIVARHLISNMESNTQ
ncbi:hypothetical protein CR513_34189, partial [Mucuna pruriens]